MATKQQIARWTSEAGAEAVGDEDAGNAAAILRVAAIESATETDLVFCSTEDTLRTALRSPAGLILASGKVLPEETDNRILRVKDPRLAFSIAAEMLMKPSGWEIHPTAVVSADASLGPNVSIGAGAVIGAGVRLGKDSTVGARAVVEDGVVIGERVRIQAGAVLGSLGFGYARRPNGSYVLFPQQGTLVIEDDVEIGANSTVDRGALGETRIGAGTKIDNLVHVGHNCRIGKNVILAAQTGISGSTVVEDGAILGGQVGIGEHAVVGRGVILGGGAGVLSNKKLHGPGMVFWGRPAQPLKQYLRDLARLRKRN